MSSTSDAGTPIKTRSVTSTVHSTSSLAGSLAIGQQEADNAVRPRPKASRRRDKPQLSCNLCRRSKLRCDRQQPCSSCSSRGQICTYAENHANTLLARPGLPVAPDLHDRLVQLERLVKSLMPTSSTKSNLGPTSDILPTEIPMDGGSDCGSMRTSSSELQYVGGDHWATILDNIADLKDHFDREEQIRLADSIDHAQDDNCKVTSSSSHALLLYGCHQPDSQADLLAALPPKATVDRYISRYFNYLDLVATSTVHGPSFLREYEKFWIKPSGVPVMWVGLLFSMISLAMASDTSDSQHGNEAEQQSLQFDMYHEKTVQCLILGEYTKSGPYVLETLINYVYVEYSINADAGKDIWFLLALQVNLALRMGYHRDPSHFPDISPLHGEMRRRLWATVLMGDILISSQMGMPRMISDWKCDTSEPRNLNDTDLDGDIVELPPPRPETENTTAMGIIARRRILMALGTISDLMDSIKSSSYAEVMRVDTILHEAAASIPPPLKMKSMAASVTDSPQLIMSRLFIGHMFYKGQTMLHRRFLYMQSPSRDKDIFVYSRKACLDASLGMLQIQQVLDEETCPGGQLYTMRWRVTSIINHQFLTATMILCSLLHRGQTQNRREEITAALRKTRTIWMRKSSSSREAKMAAETLNFVLLRAREGPGHNIDLGIHGDGVAVEQCDVPITNYPTTNDSGSSIGDTNVIQDFIVNYEPERLVVPAQLRAFLPPHQHNQNSNFNIDTTEMGTALDEWMQMNWPWTGE